MCVSATIQASLAPVLWVSSVKVLKRSEIKTLLPFCVHCCRSAWCLCTRLFSYKTSCACCQSCFRSKHQTRCIFHEVNIFTIDEYLVQDHSKNTTVSFWYSYQLRLCQVDIALLLFMRKLSTFMWSTSVWIVFLKAGNFHICCFMERNSPFGEKQKICNLFFYFVATKVEHIESPGPCFVSRLQLPQVVCFLHYTLSFLQIAAVLSACWPAANKPIKM